MAQRRRSGAEQSGWREGEDMNRERLLFCCTSLVGRKVEVKVRNNTVYEGLFHSCALDGDFSITLRCARQLPSGDSSRSGAPVETLVIPGRDFLQVSTTDGLPPPEGHGYYGFATDAEISRGKASGGDRELVPWVGGDPSASETLDALESAEGGPRRVAPWDQFAANSQMYGITSTYSDELYTTKLDPQAIPREKREEAERIAREIESGPMASSREGCLEEEPAVPPDAGGRQQLALTREHLSQHESASDGAFALEHRTKRGMITAHSPLRPPMVSEMKRINALNLEPALPKLDDKTRSDWINFKSQTRNTSKSVHGASLKSEFQQSLEVINSRTMSKEQVEGRGQEASSSQQPPESPTQDEAGAAEPAARSSSSKRPEMNLEVDTRTSTLEARSGSKDSAMTPASKFSFNPAAKEFSFNPSAATFTPTHGSAPAMSPQQAKKETGPQLQLFPAREQRRRRLSDLLDGFFHTASGERTERVSPEWAASSNVSYREVLGRPTASGQLPTLVMPPGGGTAGGAPGWQQQQQARAVGSTAVPTGPMPTGMGPTAASGQMMQPQGYMVTTAPGGQQGQMCPQGQMYQHMYGGCMGQRPPGQGGMMPPGQAGGQAPMGYGPQAGPMGMRPPGAVMMPTAMMPPQGGQMGPKFGTMGPGL